MHINPILGSQIRPLMKVYNPKEWLSVLFFFQKSDTLIKLTPLLALIFVYSLGVAYFELEYLPVGENSWVQHIPVMHSLLSFVISMLLVFRTNSAYDRCWEGRKLWGSLVNASRNLVLETECNAADGRLRQSPVLQIQHSFLCIWIERPPSVRKYSVYAG